MITKLCVLNAGHCLGSTLGEPLRTYTQRAQYLLVKEYTLNGILDIDLRYIPGLRGIEGYWALWVLGISRQWPRAPNLQERRVWDLPYTRNLKLWTLNPKPQTRNPKP